MVGIRPTHPTSTTRMWIAYICSPTACLTVAPKSGYEKFVGWSSLVGGAYSAVGLACCVLLWLSVFDAAWVFGPSLSARWAACAGCIGAKLAAIRGAASSPSDTDVESGGSQDVSLSMQQQPSDGGDESEDPPEDAASCHLDGKEVVDSTMTSMNDQQAGAASNQDDCQEGKDQGKGDQGNGSTDAACSVDG